MKILAIAKVDPHTTTEKIQPHLAAEVEHAWRLYKEGAVREMYTCQDRRLGVVFVLECGSVDEARKSLDELPFVREKFIDFEIIPLGPFSFFEMLFRDYGPPQRG
ncbi:MAG: superoxide dismutase [Spirochaetes bacterium]|nr:superoxide dismutase [Spirochaetota bacterium]